MTHSFIDCVLEAREKYEVEPEEVEEIECRIEERCYHIVCEPEAAKKNPQTDYMMRFSLPYVVSVALSKGKVSPWEIDMRLARDSRIGGLMNRVRCVADDGKRNPGYFPGWLKIRLRDGREFVFDQRWEKGTPQNPVDLDAVMEKFSNNLEHFYTEAQIKQLAELLQSFEKMDGAQPLLKALEIEKAGI